MKDAFRAVFWSFFGVRRKSEYEADAKRLSPQAVIAAGIVTALAIVIGLYILVKVVTR
jgi:preprotein translocase subunit Sec61beta